MKNTFVGIPHSLFHPILIVTAAVMLTALSTAMLFAHGNGQQEKERSIQIKLEKTSRSR